VRCRGSWMPDAASRIPLRRACELYQLRQKNWHTEKQILLLCVKPNLFPDSVLRRCSTHGTQGAEDAEAALSHTSVHPRSRQPPVREFAETRPGRLWRGPSPPAFPWLTVSAVSRFSPRVRQPAGWPGAPEAPWARLVRGSALPPGCGSPARGWARSSTARGGMSARSPFRSGRIAARPARGCTPRLRVCRARCPRSMQVIKIVQEPRGAAPHVSGEHRADARTQRTARRRDENLSRWRSAPRGARPSRRRAGLRPASTSRASAPRAWSRATFWRYRREPGPCWPTWG
jgi:hypothetical protein